MVPGLSFLARYENAGLLILRGGIGLSLSLMAYHDFLGGVPTWSRVGGMIAVFGIHWGFAAWGFLGTAVPVFGGAFMCAGLFTRVAALLNAAAFVVSAAAHLHAGHGFRGSIFAIEVVIVCVAIVILGPGRYSVDARLE